MRPMWKGTVSFGLVSIPVSLYGATESKNVTFHQVHVVDGGRIRNARICSADGKEVPYTEVAEGYELPGGGLVILTDEDLASLPVASSRTIEVLEFVPLASIDPVYYEGSYYVEPQQTAVKPYLLLRDALVKYGHVAVAKVTLRHRESLAVLRVYADVILLNTMMLPDEIRQPDFAFLHEPQPEVRRRELDLAGSLIDSMPDQVFDPGKYKDEYREALQALIEAKIAGREVAKAPPPDGGTTPTDLTSALSASVEAVTKGRGRTRSPAAEAKEQSGQG